MELDELHILYPAFSPVDHGHSVAGRDRGICRCPVSLAIPARRQQGDFGEYGHDLVGMLIESVNAITLDIGCRFGDQEAQMVLGDQIEDKPMLNDLYILLFADGL